MGSPGVPSCPEGEFRELVAQHGKERTAKILGVNRRKVYERIKSIENRTGLPVQCRPSPQSVRLAFVPSQHPEYVELSVPDGVVIVASDAHYWPGPPSTAHLALIKFVRELCPKALIMNGDVIDASTISRYPPIGWERRPSVVEEIEAAQERLHELEMVALRGCRLVWPLGNHDARFETRLASVAPEFAKLHGVHLKDHFSNRWEPCWASITNHSVFAAHRFRGGVHHGYNDTLHAGMTTATGDKHALNITAFSDLRGTRWGIDTGMIADPYDRQFRDYSEGRPRNHRSGFVVLTFEDGELLWPEVVRVSEPGIVEFRGRRYDVSEQKAPRSPEKPKAKAKGIRRRGRGRRAPARSNGRGK